LTPSSSAEISEDTAVSMIAVDRFIYFDKEGSRIVRNNGTSLSDFTASWRRLQQSSLTVKYFLNAADSAYFIAAFT